MSAKLIPHIANSLQLAVTKTKSGGNDNLVLDRNVGSESTFEDAPQDGKMYARKDGEWVEIPTATS